MGLGGPRIAGADALTINDALVKLGGRGPVVIDLDDDVDRQAALRYIAEIRSRFHRGAEVVDARRESMGSLRAKLQGGFVLYGTAGTQARVVPLVVQGTFGKVRLTETRLAVESLKLDLSGRDLRFISVARNPFGHGPVVAYVAAGNRPLYGINGVFHGPFSYHVYAGTTLRAGGMYDERFRLAPDALPRADAVRDASWFFATIESVHPDPAAALGERGDTYSATLPHSRIPFGVSYKEFASPVPEPGDRERGVQPDFPVTDELLQPFRAQADPLLAFALSRIAALERSRP